MTANKIIYVEPELISSDSDAESIAIEDNLTIETGMHLGRIKNFSTFQSKDKQNTYAKVVIGTQVNGTDGQKIIIELDRIWLADYRNDSHLVKQLKKLGAVQDKQFYPDKLFNQAVQFEVVVNENASENSKYKERISTITPVKSLPDDLDFRYVRLNRLGDYEIVPTNDTIKPVSKTKKGNKKTLDELIAEVDNFDEQEDDDFLSCLDEDDMDD